MKSKLYAFLHFLLIWPARLIFLITVRGQKNEPKISEGSYIVCANHISALDPVYICAAMRHQQPRFMAKKELFSNKFLAALIGGLGAYPVDRTGKDAGVIFKTIEMLEGGKSIGMFPQGTRRRGQNPEDTPVKNGIGLICSKSKAQVLPVFILSKNNEARFLRPVKIIIGKPVKYEEYTQNGANSTDITYITKYLFDKVCELGKSGEKDA